MPRFDLAPEELVTLQDKRFRRKAAFSLLRWNNAQTLTALP
jgi:hypothetical protein